MVEKLMRDIPATQIALFFPPVLITFLLKDRVKTWGNRREIHRCGGACKGKSCGVS